MLAVQRLPVSFKTISLETLPNELLLEIIPYIYTPHDLACLCLTCARLNRLIRQHEHSLVRDIKRCQNLGSLRLFPSLKTETFDDLSTLYNRLATLDDLHEQWLKITSYGPELNWLKGRWESVHKAGLLLLHRLQDSGSYNYKVAIINGLSSTSLACLLFKLISSIKILRIYGPEPIKGTYAAGDIMQRSDIELAFEEMLLQYGPEFFISMLKAGEIKHRDQGFWAINALENEVLGMIERQLPSPDGNPKPPTLTSCLRRAIAAKLGCHISQNVSKMWEILSSTSFDEVDEEKLVKIVNGEELKGGMKRIF